MGFLLRRHNLPATDLLTGAAHAAPHETRMLDPHLFASRGLCAIGSGNRPMAGGCAGGFPGSQCPTSALGLANVQLELRLDSRVGSNRER